MSHARKPRHVEPGPITLALASLPKYCTGVFRRFVSGVSTPIKRTRSQVSSRAQLCQHGTDSGTLPTILQEQLWLTDRDQGRYCPPCIDDVPLPCAAIAVRSQFTCVKTIKEKILKMFSGLITLVCGRDMTYRRVIGGSVWHSSEKCKLWPRENFEEMTRSPQFGLCPACARIEANKGTRSTGLWGKLDF